MDIKIPLPASSLTIAKSNISSLPLQINQQLDVKVVEIKTDQNTLALQLANKIIQVQGNQPLNVSDGQTLSLQVVKLQPVPEFKIVNPPVQQLSQPAAATPEATLQKQAEIILKLVLPQPADNTQAKTVSNIQAQSQKLLSQLVSGQHLHLKLIEVSSKNLTGLLVSNPQTNASNTDSNQVIKLPNNQISNLPTITVPLTDNKNNAPLVKLEQIITLEVIKPGSQPQFKMVHRNPADVTEQKIAETFKRYLPIQDSPAVLFTHLLKHIPELEKNEKIPQTLKRLAREILQNLPQKSQITNAETLKQQVLNSGRFLEAKLAQLIDKSDSVLQDDFKLKLLKLIDYLKQQPESKAEQKPQIHELNLFKEILQKSNNTLARIILDQLNSLPKEESNKQTWSLELPFLNNDQTEKVSIEIEHDQEPDKPEQKDNWSVSITISPPELGTIHCKLNCYDHVVSTRFWSEQPNTVAKINSHLGYLKQQLENNGINPGLMDVQQGKPEQRRQQKPLGQNLLNEKV